MSATDPQPTHLCLDCGAVGHAGGYHDHGGGEAGDTCSIEQVLTALRSAGEVADERDEALAERDRLQREVERLRVAETHLWSLVVWFGARYEHPYVDRDVAMAAGYVNEHLSGEDMTARHRALLGKDDEAPEGEAGRPQS